MRGYPKNVSKEKAMRTRRQWVLVRKNTLQGKFNELIHSLIEKKVVTHKTAGMKQGARVWGEPRWARAPLLCGVPIQSAQKLKENATYSGGGYSLVE